ncbi:hypothetical protein [Candidatus Rhodobacter oscarellae]|uniref:hypothetical protein n=1 Tax=Candidatus Rhodobacter oscarellae TaxID=1675527 RepID=UPI000671090E|nr:hypothetical protein [Candidatus Rhodobacter lobularis]
MRDAFAPALRNRPTSPAHLSPERWIIHLFSSQAAASGGVVRRKSADVERIVGWPRFRQELSKRGYRAVINAGQVVIFCNKEPVRIFE